MGNRRRMMASRKKVLFTKRFYPAGTYTWTVPDGCDSVDVFLVGAGGGAWYDDGMGSWGGGGGGYTKTYRGSGYIAPTSGTWVGTSTEGRDGNAVSVQPGQSISITVGAGVAGGNGGYSQFMNSSYRANGGTAGGSWDTGGNGGSGGSSLYYNDKSHDGGSDGSNGSGERYGKGQGHTTRDFGEATGKRNAGGGSSAYKKNYYSAPSGGASDYDEGKGGYNNASWSSSPYWTSGFPGGGYGGGGGAIVDRNGSWEPTRGGDGTVLIRYYAYE